MANERIIRLDGKSTTYLIRINSVGHLENLYYGKKLRYDATLEALLPNRTVGIGTGVAYSEKNTLLFLETACLETSTPGKGDFRTPAVQVEYGNGMTTLDFVYYKHRLLKGKPPVKGLDAQSYVEGQDAISSVASNAQNNKKSKNSKATTTDTQASTKEEAITVQILLKDKVLPIVLQMNYTMFTNCDVIARSCILTNKTEEPITIRNLASLQLDIPDSNWNIVSFDGAWGRERNITRRHLESGITEISSNCGVSSAYHNPAIFLERPDGTETRGDCYAFNLIYSGNHREVIEKSPFGQTRFQTGINPQTFSWVLKPGEDFTTPEAVMTYSSMGSAVASTNMQSFVNNHIVRGAWKFRERPILCNNWEATYFNFTEEGILDIARAAKELGIELFVLDDGWFGQRDNDTSSLGDWFVNTKKLPDGITKLSNTIHGLGMMFGLWVEPEMVSRLSLLYDRHPDWAIIIPGRDPSVGRNQFILDLTRQDVRDYLVQAMSEIFTIAKVDYVKWDMNRIFSDIHTESNYNLGQFSHRYVLGLYDILKRLTAAFPDVLFEGCASGGNRFDLGILCFMPQIWTSDNTDALCRTAIQTGTSYAYPPSTMGAHISASPNHQTLRKTEIETRFNVSSFGILGYEMDLSTLSAQDKQIIQAQISFYKHYRALFQYGRLYRLSDGPQNRSTSDPTSNNQVRWLIANTDFSEMLVLDFQILNQCNIWQSILRIPFARPDFNYAIETRLQKVPVSQFGSLINMVSPLQIKANSQLKKIIDKNIMLDNEQDYHIVSGDILANSGIRLSPQFSGVGFSNNTRVLGDFDSRIYHLIRVQPSRKH